jgi:hypothetical protein
MKKARLPLQEPLTEYDAHLFNRFRASQESRQRSEKTNADNDIVPESHSEAVFRSSLPQLCTLQKGRFFARPRSGEQPDLAIDLV